MAESTQIVASTPAAAPASPKKKSAVAKARKPAAPAAHPTTAVMVTKAVKELGEKKGSSLPAIKKYLAANYKVDTVKLAPFIRKFLKAAVAKGVLVQTNGSGASGHFKLAAEAKKPAKKQVVKKKPVAAKKPAASTPKKRKLTSKKVKFASEPAKKKVKKVTAAKTAPKTNKISKSPVKAKKAAATKAKLPKANKPPVKKPTSPKKK